MEETAEDYSNYLKINAEGELETLQKLVDNMLIRVEEFGSILNVVKAEGEHCMTEIVPQLENYRGEVNSITKKIDSLESFLGRVNSDLDVLEKQVQKAEEVFRGDSADVKFKKLFKPLMGIKNQPSSANEECNNQSYLQHTTFETSEYFYGGDTDTDTG